MMAKIARFIGIVLAELIPTLIKMWQAPRKVVQRGNDKKARKAIDDHIRDDALNSHTDRLRRDEESKGGETS